jgi:hypothetical protein
MTPQPTAASPGVVRTVPTDATPRHHSAFFWDVDECCWQCVTYPAVRNALERYTATGRPIAHSDRETRP